MNLFRNLVSPRHIANLCGPPLTELDVIDTGDKLGMKGSYNRYERREARQIAKLMLRAADADLVERLHGAYTQLADERESEAPV